MCHQVFGHSPFSLHNPTTILGICLSILSLETPPLLLFLNSCLLGCFLSPLLIFAFLFFSVLFLRLTFFSLGGSSLSFLPPPS